MRVRYKGFDIEVTDDAWRKRKVKKETFDPNQRNGISKKMRARIYKRDGQHNSTSYKDLASGDLPGALRSAPVFLFELIQFGMNKRRQGMGNYHKTRQ